MTEDYNTERERKKIAEVAREYTQKGYKVSVLPRGSKVPAFLRELSFSPDLLAISDKESYVIEVSSRDTAEQLKELSLIVDAIEKRRGWNFVLVMTNPRRPRVAPSPPRVPNLDELEYAYKKVLELTKISTQNSEDFSHAVLLSAWSIVEGALRMYLDTGKSKVRSRTPSSIVRDAVMMGFLDQAEGEFLTSVSRLRNEIAHGAVSTKVNKVLINKLVNICGALVISSET